MIQIKVKLDKGAYIPTKAHADDAAYDLYTPVGFHIYRNEYRTIDTGVHIVIPKGYCGVFESKSGLNTQEDIVAIGLVDAGYTGSIKVKLNKLSCHDGYADLPEGKYFRAGDKIAQIRIVEVPTTVLVPCDELPDTDRGDGGFGSTGR